MCKLCTLFDRVVGVKIALLFLRRKITRYDRKHSLVGPFTYSKAYEIITKSTSITHIGPVLSIILTNFILLF